MVLKQRSQNSISCSLFWFSLSRHLWALQLLAPRPLAAPNRCGALWGLRPRAAASDSERWMRGKDGKRVRLRRLDGDRKRQMDTHTHVNTHTC